MFLGITREEWKRLGTSSCMCFIVCLMMTVAAGLTAPPVCMGIVSAAMLGIVIGVLTFGGMTIFNVGKPLQRVAIVAITLSVGVGGAIGILIVDSLA